MEPICAIINPLAGNGSGVRRWRRVAAELERHGVSSEMFVTEASGHATSLVRRCFEREGGTVVAVGGDGTVHEVINGLFADPGLGEKVRLGVVPAGTAMDFMRNIGAVGGTRQAAKRLLENKERKLDLGVATTEANELTYFVNFAETGIGASVVAHEARSQRELPGRASYMLSAVEAIREHRSSVVTVLVDDLVIYEGPAVSVVAANGAFFGGGMKIAPGAVMWDGALDVVVLGDFTRAELIANMWKIYPGVHVRMRKVTYRQGTRVQVVTERRTGLDLDGELYDFGSYQLSVVPGSLRLLA